jgi:predicted kinase
MPILYIPVGIPGCGKSHLAGGLDAQVVSTDHIREQLTGDASRQDANATVFDRFHGEIHVWLREGRSVYADATNLTHDSRRQLFRIARAYNDISQVQMREPVRIHLILFRNLAQAIVRNQQRERVVPADVMVRMIEKYERSVVDIMNDERSDYDYVTEVNTVR